MRKQFANPLSCRLAVAVLLLGGAAWAQSDVDANFAQAEKGDPASQLKLSQALEAAGLPVLAASYDAQVLQSPNASALDAVRQLLELQQKLGDEYLIPSLLASRYQEGWAKLAPEQFSRLGYLLASVELRKGQLDQARAHLTAIPKSSPDFARARYLLGVVLSDAGSPQLDEALKAFEAASAADGGLHELAQLAIARTLYALHRYPESVRAYEAIPRGSRYWSDALFEDGFARFRAGDPGGALGSLQALHAPQFAGAFQPESWILKATIYYFNCLYDESATAMRSFQDIYGPMEQTLRPLATGDFPLEDYYRLVAGSEAPPQTNPLPAGVGPLPTSVANWVRKDERMFSVFHLLDELNRESSMVAQRYQGAVRDAFDQAIAGNRQTVEKVAGQLAKNRVVEAYKSLKRFDDQSEVLRFESTKGEKELIEAGLDRKKILDSQRLYRPPMPGSDWEYWRFEGEFWSDEIGSYRYTLKNGCPSQAGAK